MDWYYLLNSFDGRIGRQTFWIALAAVVAIEILCDLISYQIDGERLTSIVDLVFTYPEFAIVAKRGHDRNMPPWVPGIFFGFGVLLDLLTVLGLAGTRDDPNALSLALALPFTVFGFALLADLGFRHGTRGPNRYGPDPVGRT